MAFLKINDVVIPVEDGSATQGLVRKGSRAASISGGLIDTRIGWRRQYTVTTTPMTMDEALGLECLVNGRGHDFTFVDGFGSLTGLVVDVGRHSLWQIGTSNIGPPTYPSLVGQNMYGERGYANAIKVQEDSLGNPVLFLTNFEIDAQMDDDKWTATWWENHSFDDAANWHQWARTSDGRGFRTEGVATCVRDDRAGIISDLGTLATFPTFLGVESHRGIFQVKTKMGLVAFSTNCMLSYLSIIPAVLTDDQIIQMCNEPPSASTLYRPFPRPFVTVSGDMIESISTPVDNKMACVGEVSEFSFVSMRSENEWVNNAVKISFDLVEFEEAYKDF